MWASLQHPIYGDCDCWCSCHVCLRSFYRYFPLPIFTYSATFYMFLRPSWLPLCTFIFPPVRQSWFFRSKYLQGILIGCYDLNQLPILSSSLHASKPSAGKTFLPGHLQLSSLARKSLHWSCLFMASLATIQIRSQVSAGLVAWSSLQFLWARLSLWISSKCSWYAYGIGTLRSGSCQSSRAGKQRKLVLNCSSNVTRCIHEVDTIALEDEVPILPLYRSKH